MSADPVGKPLQDGGSYVAFAFGAAAAVAVGAVCDDAATAGNDSSAVADVIADVPAVLSASFWPRASPPSSRRMCKVYACSVTNLQLKKTVI